MKKLLALVTIIIGIQASAFAQGPGEASAKAGMALSQHYAKKNTLNQTVKILSVEIAGKSIDAPNFYIDGTIIYSVNGQTFECAIDNVESEFGTEIRLCNEEGRSHYPEIVVKANSQATTLHVAINDVGVLYDSKVVETTKKIGSGIVQDRIEQEAGFLGVKLEGGPF